MVVLGDSMTRGRRSFSPSARLELLLRRVRRQLGRPRRGNPSVGGYAQFARFVISDELIALLSLLHLGSSSPRWILHELCQRMLCHSTSDDSSLRAGLCHLGSTETRDTYGIAPSLNYIQSFHFCHHGGSYMDVFSCVRHEMPYRHVYHRVTTYKYGSSDRCCVCCSPPLGNGSLCFVPFSLSYYGYMSGIFTYEQFPCKSHPVLTLP